jgi:hypothetical protein
LARHLCAPRRAVASRAQSGSHARPNRPWLLVIEFEVDQWQTAEAAGATTPSWRRLRLARTLIEPLESVLGGKLVLDKRGRFYLETADVRQEMPLIAEGHRKVAMLARLIANGSLVPGTTLVWDEPEANLNPRVMKDVAKAIVGLVANGVQVIAATHSLFMMREFEILLGAAKPELVARWIGLQPGSDGVGVEQGDSALDLGAVAALDENLAQSDRFLEMEAKR